MRASSDVVTYGFPVSDVEALLEKYPTAASFVAAMRAQALDNDFGKILRIRDNGSIPPDNPFLSRAGARPEIYTYGSSSFGIRPVTGFL